MFAEFGPKRHHLIFQNEGFGFDTKTCLNFLKFCSRIQGFAPSVRNLQSVKIRLDWNPKNIENLKSKNLADRLASSHFRDSLTQNMLKSNPGELTLQQTIPFQIVERSQTSNYKLFQFLLAGPMRNCAENCAEEPVWLIDICCVSFDILC